MAFGIDWVCWTLAVGMVFNIMGKILLGFELRADVGSCLVEPDTGPVAGLCLGVIRSFLIRKLAGPSIGLLALRGLHPALAREPVPLLCPLGRPAACTVPTCAAAVALPPITVAAHNRWQTAPATREQPALLLWLQFFRSEVGQPRQTERYAKHQFV